MNTSLAGYTPLRALLQQAITNGQEKVAAAEGRTGSKKEAEKPVEKPVEKTASADGIDFRNPDHMEKLASALEEAGSKLAAGEVAFMGGEKVPSTGVVPNNKPVGGKQPYKKDSATSAHLVPNSTGLVSRPDGAGPTLVPDNKDKAPGGKAYPAKGVLKNASAEILEKLKAGKAEAEKAATAKADDKTTVITPAEKTAAKTEEKPSGTDALSFITERMDKVAYGEVEKRMGGDTLDSASGSGAPKQPGDGNSDRKALKTNTGPVDLKKVQAKATEKKDLKQVLTEPALSKAHDSKVHENLQNASKGGVKIAEVAKALVEKIAAEGCTCGGKGECRYDKMMSKLDEIRSGDEK